MRQQPAVLGCGVIMVVLALDPSRGRWLEHPDLGDGGAGAAVVALGLWMLMVLPIVVTDARSSAERLASGARWGTRGVAPPRPRRTRTRRPGLGGGLLGPPGPRGARPRCCRHGLGDSWRLRHLGARMADDCDARRRHGEPARCRHDRREHVALVRPAAGQQVRLGGAAPAGGRGPRPRRSSLT